MFRANQAHPSKALSFFGYTVALCLSLTLLLPLKNDPLVGNYVLVLYGSGPTVTLPDR